MPDEADEAPSDVFEVLPENWDALGLFLDCATQWRHAPMGGLTGLDYTAVRTVIEFHDVPANHRTERFQQSRLLERGALDAMREQAKR